MKEDATGGRDPLSRTMLQYIVDGHISRLIQGKQDKLEESGY